MVEKGKCHGMRGAQRRSNIRNMKFTVFAFHRSSRGKKCEDEERQRFSGDESDGISFKMSHITQFITRASPTNSFQNRKYFAQDYKYCVPSGTHRKKQQIHGNFSYAYGAQILFKNNSEP